MGTEYLCLAILTLFFLFAWFPVSIGKKQVFGINWLASNREVIPGKELPSWAARCDRAYQNLKDYFPAFAVSVLLLGANQKFTYSTEMASILFVVARIGHYVSYGLGSFPARFGFYLLAMGSNLFLIIKLFT